VRNEHAQFSLGKEGLLVKQEPPVPGAAQGAKEEAELLYWKKFREELKDRPVF
jgi:hypothetical protein